MSASPAARPVYLPPPEEDLRRISVYNTVRFVDRLVLRGFLSSKCYGAERIPEKGPVILATTHHSFLDPLLTAAVLTRPQCFLARDTLFRMPGFGWLIRSLGAVPIRRSGVSAREGLRVCTQVLERGRVLVMFPEGTRSQDGRLQPLKSGVAFVAKRSGAPVVPALTVGTFAAWPRHRKLPRIAAVSLHIGKPLVFEKRESFDSFTERLSSAYRDLARESGAEYMLDRESGPGADSVSTPTDVESPPAAESNDASLRVTHCFIQV